MARPDADNIQFHINLANDSPVQILAQQQIYRDTAFLNKPDDYYLRVLYFFMDNSSVPLFIMDPTNPMVITLSGAFGTYSATLMPVTIFPTQPYYFYYSQQVCDSVNNAFNNAMAQLNAAESQTFIAPLLLYSNVIQGFQIVVPTTYVNYTNNGIYFNNALFSLFPGFYNIASTTLSGVLTFQILYTPTGVNFYPSGLNQSLTYSCYTADYEATGYSNLLKIKGIAVLSYTMPINQEYINYTKTSSNLNNFRPLILEIPLTIANDVGVFEDILFNNTNGFPNLIDLNSGTPLNKIDFQVFMVDVDDTLYPLYLAPSNSISMKVTFLKKSMFNLDTSYNIKEIAVNTR